MKKLTIAWQGIFLLKNKNVSYSIININFKRIYIHFLFIIIRNNKTTLELDREFFGA